VVVEKLKFLGVFYRIFVPTMQSAVGSRAIMGNVMDGPGPGVYSDEGVCPGHLGLWPHQNPAVNIAEPLRNKELPQCSNTTYCDGCYGEMHAPPGDSRSHNYCSLCGGSGYPIKRCSSFLCFEQCGIERAGCPKCGAPVRERHFKPILCHNLGCDNIATKACSKCLSFDKRNVTYYCSRECQVKDWPNHKRWHM
jgi:hypothetical protein